MDLQSGHSVSFQTYAIEQNPLVKLMRYNILFTYDASVEKSRVIHYYSTFKTNNLFVAQEIKLLQRDINVSSSFNLRI